MKNLSLFLLSFLFLACTQNKNIHIQSPDGKIQVSFGINDSSAIFYSVDFEDSILIQNSQLGFQFQDKPDFGKNLKIVSFSEMEVNQSWNPVYGERSEVKDIYNQGCIH